MSVLYIVVAAPPQFHKTIYKENKKNKNKNLYNIYRDIPSSIYYKME